MRRAALAGAALTALLAPASASALDGVYGGGAIVDRAPKAGKTYVTDNVAVGLRRAADGRSVAIRVSFALRCATAGADGWRGTDAVTSAPLAADGTFHLKAKAVRTIEMGRVRLTIDGTLAPGRADGTLRLKTHWACGAQVRPWTARTADAAAIAPAPPAPADGVLYGLVGQDLTSAKVPPRGIVVKVEDGGTVAHAFAAYRQTCRPTYDAGRYLNAEELLAERPIAGGVWSQSRDAHQTAADRRHGIRWHRVWGWKGTFAGPALTGTLWDDATLDYAKVGDYKGRCTTGQVPFVAVP